MFRNLLVGAVLIAITLNSCKECIKGVGEVMPETRSLATFDEVTLDSFIDVKFRQLKSGEVNKAVITAQESLLPYIKTEVIDGEFILSIEECLDTEEEITVELYGKSMSSLANNGSGDFSMDGKLVSDKLEINCNGSGDIELTVDANDIELDLNGSGDITLAGASDYFEVRVNGSGTVHGIDLRTFDSEVSVNGSGDVFVYAKENLEVDINGSGDVIYKGKAKHDATLNGSGIVKSYK